MLKPRFTRIKENNPEEYTDNNVFSDIDDITNIKEYNELRYPPEDEDLKDDEYFEHNIYCNEDEDPVDYNEIEYIKNIQAEINNKI
jgi:hypothetical protein